MLPHTARTPDPFSTFSRTWATAALSRRPRADRSSGDTRLRSSLATSSSRSPLPRSAHGTSTCTPTSPRSAATCSGVVAVAGRRACVDHRPRPAHLTEPKNAPTATCLHRLHHAALRTLVDTRASADSSSSDSGSASSRHARFMAGMPRASAGCRATRRREVEEGADHLGLPLARRRPRRQVKQRRAAAEGFVDVLREALKEVARGLDVARQNRPAEVARLVMKSCLASRAASAPPSRRAPTSPAIRASSPRRAASSPRRSRRRAAGTAGGGAARPFVTPFWYRAPQGARRRRRGARPPPPCRRAPPRESAG